MVNEVVGTGDWENSDSLGETWRGRNAFSYGRNEGGVEAAGTARPEVLDKLLATTERVVQEVDSVEYGLSDIQEYYANTGGAYLGSFVCHCSRLKCPSLIVKPFLCDVQH